MVNRNSSLLDFVEVYKKSLSPAQCDFIVSNHKGQWNKHTWADYDNIIDTRLLENEFEVTYAKNPQVLIMLRTAMYKNIEAYMVKYKFYTRNFTNPRINRYDVGKSIENHYDHITSIFSGKEKGIPIISIVGLLNDNFQGGKFYFWNDLEINIEKGDILIFPSIFIYEHSVSTVTSGERWSFVSWAY